MKEVWIVIEGYNSNYYVSNFGRVKSVDRYVKSRYGKQRLIRGRILRPSLSHNYNYVGLYIDNKYKRIRVGRLVLESFTSAQKELYCDHIDRNKANDRLDNLRWVTPGQNMMNIGSACRGTSQYKGVSFSKSRGRWVSSVNKCGQNYFIGRFLCEIEAAKAYDKKAKELFGEYAYTNFKENDET